MTPTATYIAEENCLQEAWVDIPGYEGFYQISDHGKIRSVDRLVIRGKNHNLRRRGRELKFHLSRGYAYTDLSKNGVCEKKKVHRLVAETFIPNPENKPQVNHKNGVKNDNRVVNLEWCTGSENMKHAVNVLGTVTISHKVGEDSTLSKLKEADVFEFFNYLKQGQSIGNFAILKNISKPTLREIILGRTWRHLPINWDEAFRYKTDNPSDDQDAMFLEIRRKIAAGYSNEMLSHTLIITKR